MLYFYFANLRTNVRLSRSLSNLWVVFVQFTFLPVGCLVLIVAA